ncbi:MAG: alpha/beta hydrolase [Actinomycetota bacterium]
MAFAAGTQGNRVAYDITGEGDVDLVLIHGITENRKFWDPLTAPFAETYRVIRVDLPGHGESGPISKYGIDDLAREVKAVVDEVGNGDPYVVGHSLGGYVASVYAARYPVRAVVNIDQPLMLAAFKEQLEPAEEMLRGEAFGAVVGGMFEGFMAPLPDGEKERINSMRRPDQDVVLGVWDPIFALTVEQLHALVGELLAGITAPYLAIHGIDLGPDYEPWLKSAIPQAEYELWADSGHYPHLLHADRFVERVTAFA